MMLRFCHLSRIERDYLNEVIVYLDAELLIRCCFQELADAHVAEVTEEIGVEQRLAGNRLDLL